MFMLMKQYIMFPIDFQVNLNVMMLAMLLPRKRTAAKEHVIISMDAVFGPCQL